VVRSCCPRPSCCRTSPSDLTEKGPLDTRGYESIELVIATGSIADADATFVVLIEDGDSATLTDAAAVSDTFLLGTEALAGFQFDDDNECRKIGYVGGKRYVRATITPASNASAALFSAVWVLGNARTAPSANPPA
jgi:hypothetical protein